MFHKVQDPFPFQGYHQPAPYFEGWYYKQVSPDRRLSFVLIPGISRQASESYAFIQYYLTDNRLTGDSTQPAKAISGFIKYPLSEVDYCLTPFRLTIGASTFHRFGVELDLVDADFFLKGHLSFQQLTPLKKTLYSPTIMGPLTYLNDLECNHGVISMTHSVSANLRCSLNDIQFSNGKGYLEKDWGSSFPKHYIWLQSNHFHNPSTSLFFSYATLPFLGNKTKGFVGNLLMDRQQYRFATYTHHQLKKIIHRPNHLELTIVGRQFRLQINATSGQGALLKSPTARGMTGLVNESLNASVRFQLDSHKFTRPICDQADVAGLEIV